MTDDTSIHVARAIAGDQASMGWLITHLRGLVEAQVRLRLRGHGAAQDIEDLAADVWVITLQQLPHVLPRDGRHAPALVRFLGTTVLGTCNNFLRRRARLASRSRDHVVDDSGADTLDRVATQTRSVVTRILQQERTAAVDACLRHLAPDHRDVLVLRLMEQRSDQDIAALVGVPADTIAARHRRALEELRQRLPESLFAELTGHARDD